MQCQDLISQQPITCMEYETLDAAARKMWDHDCGVIPIVDGESRLRGVLTDRDISMAAYLEDSPLREIPIAQVMTREVVACAAEDDVHLAEERMRERRVRRVPIVDGEQRVVGVLSMNDIARRAVSAPSEDLTEHDVVDTLAAICEPRFAPQAAEPA